MADSPSATPIPSCPISSQIQAINCCKHWFINRKTKQDLLDSFNEYSREHKPTHRNWEARRFCCQFKKLVPFANEKRTGSGPGEYQFPSLNECKLHFADKYSLDSDVFEIN